MSLKAGHVCIYFVFYGLFWSEIKCILSCPVTVPLVQKYSWCRNAYLFYAVCYSVSDELGMVDHEQNGNTDRLCYLFYYWAFIDSATHYGKQDFVHKLPR